MNFTNSTGVLSVRIEPIIIHYFSLVISSFGIIVIIISVKKNKYILAFFSSLLTIVSILHSASNFKYNDIKVINGLIALDSITSVLLTFAIAYSSGLYKTLIGFFRILWLILLVTSSSSYATISAFTGKAYLPNDISIIAISVSVFTLICMSCVSRCLKKKEMQESSVKHVISEYSLVIGALILRFQFEIQKIFSILIGWESWHISCWISVIVTSTIHQQE